MAGRTDWRGTLFGVFVGIAGAGVVVIWPTAIIGWTLIAIGTSGAVMAALHRWLQPLVTASFGAVVFIFLVCSWARFRDQILGLQPLLPGPRLEFQGIHVDNMGESDALTVHINNTSDIAASAVAGTIVVFSSKLPNLPENEDVKKGFEKGMEQLQKYSIAASHTMQITRGMGIELKMQRPHSDIADVKTGRKFVYIIVLAKYVNATIPDEVRVTEMCAQITDPYTGFESCPKYNDYFVADSTSLSLFRRPLNFGASLSPLRHS